MSTELLDLDERIGREIEDIERTVQLAARSLLQRAALEDESRQ